MRLNATFIFLFMFILSLSISGKNYKLITPCTLDAGLLSQNLQSKRPDMFLLWFPSLGGVRGGLYKGQLIPGLLKEQKLNKDSVPHKVISKNGTTREYQAVPDACRLNNGDILVVFYDGDDHVTYPNPEYPNAGRICLTRSKDKGCAWSNPVVIYDDVNDNRDPHINQMSDGSLILSFFSLEFEVSGSQGLSGEEPSYTKEQDDTPGAYPSTIELKDGSILMNYYEEGKGGSIRAKRFKLPEAENNEQFSEPQQVEALPLKPEKSVTNTLANWQLFIDDYWIENAQNIETKLHQPEKYSNNPIIKSDVHWEENPYCFGTVIFDKEDSIFKFWYQSYNHVEVMQERTPILYSTSKDGINWFRPNLGVIEYQGSTDNNIVLQNYGFHDLYSPSVIKDNEDTDLDKRYKMIWWDFPLGEKGYQDDGMCVAFSPDGIHWTKHPGNPVLHASKKAQSISDVMSVMQDKKTGKFVAYTKGWAEPWPAFRQIVRTESNDFIHWSEPEVVLSHKHNVKDPQSYGMTVSQYGNSYIGLLHSYKKPGDETIDVQLTVSHDNKKWERVSNQQTFLPLGKPGSWDDGMLFCAPMFNHGDKTLIYYGGWDNSHNSKEPRHSGIGLATLRLNGFVSLDAGRELATVTTRAIQNADGPLLVNADAGKGTLRAALIDADGNTIPGYSLEDCLPINKDGIAQVVRWKKHSELPKTVNILRIRFEMVNTELYGFFAGREALRFD